MRKSIVTALVVSLLVITVGCATRGSSTYTRQQLGRVASVSHGVIVSMRIVEIAGTSSGVGATAGAAGGAVVGSYVGGGTRGTVLGVIGGAVIGGIAGAVIEGAATQTTATEFLIQEENGDLIAIVQKNDDNLQPDDHVLIMRLDRVRIVRDPAFASDD